VTDEDAWEPLETGLTFKRCTLLHARPEKLEPSGLSWSSCGEGCSELDTFWMGDWSGATSLSALRTSSGSVVPLLSGRWRSIPRSIRRLVDLETGLVKNALQGISPEGDTLPDCPGGIWLPEARFLGSLAEDPTTKEVLTADHWLRLDGQVKQGPLHPVFKGSSALFFSDALGGSYFRAAGDITRIDFSTGTSEALGVNDVVLAADGEGDLAVWVSSEWPTPEKGIHLLRAWAPDGKGPRTLTDQIPREGKQTVRAVALSPTKVVGTLVKPNPSATYIDDELRLWYSSRTAEPGKTTVVLGPPLPLPQTLGSGLLKTWGDYALLRVRALEVDQFSYWVIHLPTWTIHRYETPKGFWLADRGFAITDKAVFFGLLDMSKIPTYHDAAIIKRYDLDKLDVTASSVVKAAP
jgi:hypothetical protein